jgi:hypothetical protein
LRENFFSEILERYYYIRIRSLDMFKVQVITVKRPETAAVAVCPEPRTGDTAI